jgi:alpha-amylase
MEPFGFHGVVGMTMRDRNRSFGGNGFRACLLALIAGAAASTASGNDTPVIMQWFESKWQDMERRVPDWYVAGYGAVWLPPPSKASTNSAGYDVWDRFDLGRPGSQTAYGTEKGFKAAVDELHQANGLVYIDSVLNHNGARQTSASFQAAGGYPQFWMAPGDPPVNKTPTSNWGDFHAGNASGYLQSQDPNSANYDLFKGDLVSLIDIAQETNFQFIRNPVVDGNPDNIPAGTSVNKPSAGNYRFYPDQQLPGKSVTNPGTSRNPGVSNFTFYPYNLTDAIAGDPYKDNTTGVLMRWTQWMMDTFGVDGFRWDAVKHVPSWFWDTFIDSVLFERRRTPDGRFVTPFSFGESVEGGSYSWNNLARKDAFANRDCLDITGSGELRNLLNSGGFGSWQTVVNSHFDVADNGLNDGSFGVNHSFSHDNGTTGDGNSAPANPTVRQMGYPMAAYFLMRTGVPKVFHNARGISRSGGFWPRQGFSTALGWNPTAVSGFPQGTPDPQITTLVRLHNFYARGEFNIINGTDTVNPNLNDVIVFERRKNLGGGQYSANVLVGANDRWDAGFDQRSVTTSFPAGTRLIEMTGNAADATVDPNNDIADVLVVDSNRRVTIRIPRNRSGSTEHGRGYVVYGPAIPGGTLTLSNVAFSLPADDPAITSFSMRRLNPIPVIESDSFQIQLTTVNGDSGAGNNDSADDNAVFRINQGFVDRNGNGVVDIDYQNAVVPGYEQFVTQRVPLAGTANANGLYKQTIDATALPEGLNYISVVAFRKRNASDDALFREFRQPVVIDRVGPAVALRVPDQVTTTSFQFWMDALDRTANKVHLIANLPDGADAVAAANFSNQATRNDRFEYFRTLTGLTTHGYLKVTVVAFEETGNASATDYQIWINRCPADFDRTGFVDGDDFDAFVQTFEQGDDAADFDGSGFVDGDDFDAFVQAFEIGC